ncbi:hypothetical protein F4819DRAFT_8251 [Hypoxylon fuscum]|nr:hypothetical protein F4819DRAFT_8251 [Hypoxylon fuscum]
MRRIRLIYIACHWIQATTASSIPVDSLFCNANCAILSIKGGLVDHDASHLGLLRRNWVCWSRFDLLPKHYARSNVSRNILARRERIHHPTPPRTRGSWAGWTNLVSFN